MWTQFWDMHSGGDQKLDWAHIYIEQPEDEARATFERVFGRDPENVTCRCCGEDYTIQEYDTLEEATAYHRGCLSSSKLQRYIEPEEAESLNVNDFDIHLRRYIERKEFGVNLLTYLTKGYHGKKPCVIYANEIEEE